MSDIIFEAPTGVMRRYKSLGDGTHAEYVTTPGVVLQAVPDYATGADLLAAYGNFANVTPEDFVTLVETSNGQVITALSSGPITPGESTILLDVPVVQPCALEIEASTIRARHQFAAISLSADASTGPDVIPNPINIISISQSSADGGVAYTAVAGTIVTVVLESALPAPGDPGAVFLSDWVHIDGLVDNRLCYQNLCIKWISADRKTITAGFSDDSALPSLAVATISPTLGTAKIYFYNNMAGAAHGFGIRFTGTVATSAALISIFGSGDVQVSGVLTGDHRVTVGSTAPIYNAGAMGNVEIKATSRFRLEARHAECAYLDKGTDAIGTPYAARASRTAVKPAQQAKLRTKFRLYQPVGMSRPIAKIVSAVKSGSTTATVTTSTPHGLVTGKYVTCKGARDVTNFAAFTTPVQVTVIDAVTFTLIWGSAVTATSYGGSVIITNGGIDQPGIIGQAIQSATLDSNGWLALVGNTTWSGLNVGDYVNLHGVRDATAGANLGVDGAWEVANISTTQLLVKPVTNIFGTRVSPVIASLPLTNCGGSVILRTTLRAHDLMLEEWAENKVMLDGQGTMRMDKCLPVRVLASDAMQSISEATLIAPTANMLTTAATTNGTSVKTAAATLYGCCVTNPSASPIYLKLYNKASAPTVGTDVPVMTIPVAAGSFLAFDTGRVGARFGAGLALAVTGAMVATDTTAIAAGCYVVTNYI